ncbi:MAG: heavy-metal-associated domain-containing protein [Bacteroidales bacterium]|nr:heavy-metal-associated domain-containing protein [Bacteroidales bacterium]MCF8387507.1 heavy-metal-associated domain-containing protein [Bacteroidales bacterium]MCF8399142.1 heavy-metal-associated domain-containing protein [Bacteroidales bacterium]
MKSIVTFAIVLLGFGSLQAQSEIKKEEFKVYGNCGMCESRIEKAARDLYGVESADWDKKTKMMLVKYDENEVMLMDVHKAIAKVGHDTEKVEAEDKVYEGLPGCCKYDRKSQHDMNGGHEGHHH